jgi:hypothetical protein
MTDIAPIFSPQSLPNPYPGYAALRDAEPLHWDGYSWIVTGYKEVSALLRDPRVRAQRTPDQAWLEQAGLMVLAPTYRALSKMMLVNDPPDHTRLRELVSKAFTPRMVEGMRGQIQRIVDDLLDQVEAKGAFELIHDFAYPLPTMVIAEMLGIPTSEREQFKRWSDDFALFLGKPNFSHQEMQQISRSIEEMRLYFSGIADQLRQSPRPGLMTAMAQAEEQGSQLSEDELWANAVLLLAAGHETTANLIGNARG